MDRNEAESEISDAANIVSRVLSEGVEPKWLWERNRGPLKTVLDELEIAASSFAMDGE